MTSSTFLRTGPMLAEPMDLHRLMDYVADDDHVFEQKLDGHRVLINITDGKYEGAYTRNGKPYTKGVPRVIQNAAYPAGDWLFDGELVGTMFWAFDLLTSGSRDQMHEELVVRRIVMETLIAAWPLPFQIVPQARTTLEKAQLVRRAIENNFEGIIVKRANSRYEPDRRSSAWRKAKFEVTADVVVLDVRDDGKDSARLGAYDASGVLIEVGRCSLIGKVEVAVGDVIEVKYLYTLSVDPPRLYQPRLLKKRDDKTARECLTDQFRVASKEVWAG